MPTKEKLLALLESNKGLYFSGEEIAKTLCVSRAAVWKAIKSLQGQGYEIDAVTNKGYCLSPQTDVLSSLGIQKYLHTLSGDMELAVLPVAASTNACAREKAAAGAREGYTVIANEQTAGHGRFGRRFFSPSGTGVYMSIVLRPQNELSQYAVNMTTIAAVAMCEAIEEIAEEKAQIKWINDIYIRGKKVCGILTEGSFGMESGVMDYAVLGIGVNVYRPQDGFPPELEPIAGWILDTRRDDGKNRLAAAFLNRFMAFYAALDDVSYVQKYRSRSLVLGRRVTVLAANRERNALVIGIDDRCRLLVRYDDGGEDALSAGEISIQLQGDEE